MEKRFKFLNGELLVEENSIDNTTPLPIVANLKIDDGIYSIGNNVFNNVYIIGEVELSKTLVSIGEGSFYKTGIENILLPRSLETIGDYAFSMNESSNVYIETGVFGLNGPLKNQTITPTFIP